MNLPVFESMKAKNSELGDKAYYGLLDGNIGRVIGIDPGINYGITAIHDDIVFAHYGKLTRISARGVTGYMAYFLVGEFIKRYAPTVVVIEGAAYSMGQGQVFLEEIRMGFFLGSFPLTKSTEIMPPNKIRKLALGSGKMTAYDEWPTMNSNAADSIGCALAALALLKERNELS